MTGRSGTSLRLRSLAFAALGVLLAWQVVSRSFVAFLAETAPEAALAVRADDARALVNIAERKLNSERPVREVPEGESVSAGESSSRIPAFARFASKATGNEAESKGADPAEGSERLPSNAADPQVREELQGLVRAALARDPLNAQALRILGQLADAADDEDVAGQFMRASAERSLRESVAVFWLMREAFEKKDYAAAVAHADALLRTRPQVMAQAMPTLARIAEDKEANDALKKVLAENPPWRALFFTHLLANITDARTPLDLLVAIKGTAYPPTSADLRDYLALLMKHNFHELAYYVWLQFLPREQLMNAGLLFNGSFETRPSGLPFDWQVTPGSGVTIDFAKRPAEPGQRALLVEFGIGRVDFRGIVQTVILAPGSYQLKGEYRGQLVGRRGLEWRIYCAGVPLTGAPLAKTDMVTGSTPDWTEFSVSFMVPPADCRAQQVRLWFDARSASEQLVTGSMWYDRLRIVRAD